MEHLPHAQSGSPVEAIPCPRCREPLGDPDMGSEVKLSGRPCNGLHGCGGVWYRHSTFDFLKQQAEETGQLDLGADYTLNASSPGPAGALEIHCPECATPMAQRHFRFEGRATPIVLDDCASHGVWFDAEELEAALQVVRAHAQAHARHQEQGTSTSTAQNPNPADKPNGISAAAAEFAKERRTFRPRKEGSDHYSDSAVAATEFFADVTLGALFAIFFD